MSAYEPTVPLGQSLSLFPQHEVIRSTSTPPGFDARLGLPPALSLPVPICTSVWREALWELSVLPKKTTQSPWPGLKPRPLNAESNTLGFGLN